MSDPVIVALITGVCAVFGQWLVGRGQAKQKKADDAVRDARMEDRLAVVEEKLDIHNGYAEKLSEIQTDIAVIKNDIRTLYKRGE
jgi:hypothetical protein